jgi:hypothetical protein
MRPADKVFLGQLFEGGGHAPGDSDDRGAGVVEPFADTSPQSSADADDHRHPSLEFIQFELPSAPVDGPLARQLRSGTLGRQACTWAA